MDGNESSPASVAGATSAAASTSSWAPRSSQPARPPSASSSRRRPNRAGKFPPRQTRRDRPVRNPASLSRETSADGGAKSAGEADGGGGVMGLLAWLGASAFTTAGAVISPPANLAFLTLLDGVAKLYGLTPARLRDWLRIVGASLRHTVDVILATERGDEWRGRLVRAGGSAVDAAGTEKSRQVVVDGMVAGVKVAEALNTPETKALLRHLSVLSCRVADALSTGQSKRLMHDLGELAVSSIELAADPSTTVALAEVTAYLCHALEMEHTLRKPAIAGGSSRGRAEAARRRYERNRANEATYSDGMTLEDDAGDADGVGCVTAEEAILYSLGGGANDDDAREKGRATEHGPVSSSRERDGASSLPSRVVVSSSCHRQAGGNGGGTYQQDDGDGSVANSSIATDHTGHASPADGDAAAKTGADGNIEDDNVFPPGEPVDVDFLREGIERRGAERERNAAELRRTMRTTNVTRAVERKTGAATATRKRGGEADGGGDLDMEDLWSHLGGAAATDDGSRGDGAAAGRGTDDEAGGQGKDGSVRRNRRRTPLAYESQRAVPAAEQFRRALDEIGAERREDTLQEMFERNKFDDGAGGDALKSSPSSWYRRAAAAAGAGNERGQDTMRDALLGGIGVGTGRRRAVPSCSSSSAGSGVDRYKVLLGLAVLLALLFSAVFFALGCYGIYAFFFLPLNQDARNPPPLADGGRVERREITVRIVREVVHVSLDGTRTAPLSAGYYGIPQPLVEALIDEGEDDLADVIYAVESAVRASVESSAEGEGSEYDASTTGVEAKSDTQDD
uniref:Uncharacterized protein n=1 Tax=Odontella aurita TaxID=265563 RepID=A0A7S4MI43_9STRA|mmetsp:Transcript_22409/g.66428  ORF Transcript_22409/g.66428 Transcript_22409/m.66428 type:complete len:797 (+) Transcript_22409:183-2573(+)|eukprot:CAMPEP_0113550102 /NCGR_PEP_ID=MMETSP0015_2-20120614/13799_1 /TAXON_ID=2838 /ORGANISM="Odontella" /LENGTH=796 /DNA_ID=CAMNT_0000450879 /DNA_START=151 /DNA_END=2541 /DNA_ORIENTATION=- /assembly_acc=CAM_ASM_000160